MNVVASLFWTSEKTSGQHPHMECPSHGICVILHYSHPQHCVTLPITYLASTQTSCVPWIASHVGRESRFQVDAKHLPDTKVLRIWRPHAFRQPIPTGVFPMMLESLGTSSSPGRCRQDAGRLITQPKHGKVETDCLSGKECEVVAKWDVPPHVLDFTLPHSVPVRTWSLIRSSARAPFRRHASDDQVGEKL